LRERRPAWPCFPAGWLPRIRAGSVDQADQREHAGIDKRDGHSKEREQAGQTRHSWASSVGSKNSIRERRQRSPRRNAAGGLVTTAAPNRSSSPCIGPGRLRQIASARIRVARIEPRERACSAMARLPRLQAHEPASSANEIAGRGCRWRAPPENFRRSGGKSSRRP
jgi:hypothetical protein